MLNKAPSCLLLLLLAGACTGDTNLGEPILRQRSVTVMGSSLEVKVYGSDAAELDRALDAAVAEIQRVEDLMTDWRASPLTTLNEAAGHGPVTVPIELAQIIDRGLAIGEQSSGAFDITFAGVGKLWKFKGENQIVPTNAALVQALKNVGYQRVRVDLNANTVDLPADMRIGLGGIAKGYGVDRAMKILMQFGIKHGIVNAGGDMKILGKQRDAPWEVAIKHPRDSQRAIAILRVSNTCVVTSGDYERFFERDGKRYHHILDPRTGRPATGCISATVIAPNAEHADSLATALCVLGPELGLQLIESLPRMDAIVVDMQGQVHATKRVRGSLR